MRKLVLVAALVLTAVVPALVMTPTYDGVLDEWWGQPDVLDLGAQPAPDMGGYTLLATWDASSLYLGTARDSSDRYLGDTGWDNDSFFVAIDVDGVPGSGFGMDGYSRMNFGGTMLPDVFYAFAGGGGWYEWASWNGASFDWQGWSNAGTYYGWQDPNPDDELSIPLANIGGDAEVMIWAWMTREGNMAIEASWPAGATGEGPTMGDGIILPEPASLGLVLIGGLALLRRRR